MRLIIHKRFVSKLNAFDIIVGCVIALLLGSLLWLRLSRKTEWISLRLVVANDEWWSEGAPPQWWYVDGITPGQTAKNSFGETIAEITSVQSFDVGAYRRRAFVDLNLKGNYDTKRGVYLYNYRPLQIGKPLDLTFGKQNVHGLITYIENIPTEYQQKVIEVKLSAVQPWVAQSYKVGLQMTDSQGNVLADILSVTRSRSDALEVVELGETTEKTMSGALFEDVILTISVQTFKSGAAEYFVDRAAIKIGEKIWFQFPQTVAREAEIIRIIK